jgi:hypothetical protein
VCSETYERAGGFKLALQAASGLWSKKNKKKQRNAEVSALGCDVAAAPSTRKSREEKEAAKEQRRKEKEAARLKEQPNQKQAAAAKKRTQEEAAAGAKEKAAGKGKKRGRQSKVPLEADLLNPMRDQTELIGGPGWPRMNEAHLHGIPRDASINVLLPGQMQGFDGLVEARDGLTRGAFFFSLSVGRPAHRALVWR